MRYIPALFLVLNISLQAQTPQVPHKLHFAGMTLTIHDDARREIQKDVDALTQSPKHFNIKVERAKTYFPIIEKIFAEERLPDDFKYLVLQESALIPDAVSVSKAVGFWQFKDYTAIEMGLRIDREVDERMNIVSSTRAAARYIKKNNFYFNNWLYALQAYQMGAGGVMQTVKDSESGATKMDITSKTYWYVKKYLAHKIAFEDAINGPGNLQLVTYETSEKKSLKDLSKEVSIDEEELKSYNKWIKSSHIPGDKVYAVMLPSTEVNSALINTEPVMASAATAQPVNIPAETSRKKDERIKINGVTALKVQAGESASVFAKRASIDLSYFLKCNDLTSADNLKQGEYYFVSKKRARAEEAYHKVEQGEDLWTVSQRYGVRLKKLMRYNRLDSKTDVKPGMTLWLASRRPKNSGREVPPQEIIEIDKNETFSWTITPASIPVQEASLRPVQLEEKETIQSVKEEPIQEIVNDSINESTSPESEKEQQADSVSLVEVQVKRPENHVVTAGETLYGIARKYNLGVMDLANWNNLNLRDGIKPGQVLTLSGEETGKETTLEVKSEEIIHQVKDSDTLYSIARKYGVTIKELMDWNNKKDFNVTVGEKLKIIQK